MESTIETTTGAGNLSAVRSVTIEWSGGLSEPFCGSVADAKEKILREGLHDDGETIEKTESFDQYKILSVYEWRRGVEGLAWHFVGRVWYHPQYNPLS